MNIINTESGQISNQIKCRKKLVYLTKQRFDTLIFALGSKTTWIQAKMMEAAGIEPASESLQ